MSAESNRETVHTLYGRSYANVNLGVFLIFFGIVGAVPLYALAANIFFKQADIEWRHGIFVGLFSIALGFILINFSRRHFRVFLNDNSTGTIETQEGLLRPALRYDFSSQAKIKLAIASSDNSSSRGDLLQISLIDGARHYLLDTRPYRKLQESRYIAEFLSRSSGLNLLLPHYNNLELASTDLDLSFPDRIKKYPTLIGLEPERPASCPITITEPNNGADRRYSWGYRANGLIGQLLSLLLFVIAFSCLPIFKKDDSHYSLLNYMMELHDFTYFYIGGSVIALVALVLLGLGVTLTVEGFRVNVSYTLWGISYKQRSILIEKLEEIMTKERATGSSVMLISDDGNIAIRIANSVLANYLASDLRYYIAQK